MRTRGGLPCGPRRQAPGAPPLARSVSGALSGHYVRFLHPIADQAATQPPLARGAQGAYDRHVQVHVRLAAGLSRLAGRPRLEIDLESGATVEDLLHRLAAQHPALQPGLPSALPIVAGAHAQRDQQLTDGDGVSLLSPVAGGSTWR